MYEIFKRLLEERNLTPYKVHKATGISTATLSDWKNGRSTPKMDKLKKIADFLGVSVDYLMNGEEPKEESYYLDKDAAEIANFLHNNPEYRVLFDSSRKVKPEHIALIKELMDKFSE